MYPKPTKLCLFSKSFYFPVKKSMCGFAGRLQVFFLADISTSFPRVRGQRSSFTLAFRALQEQYHFFTVSIKLHCCK